ncbi:MAG: TIGR01458 family HAD-type hydrolase [Methanoregulaceae archaeon]|nr:TIGR01458 family HAD-type hydrolase [Methanoregulaceae archaeon]
MEPEAILIDLDGVLYVGRTPVPGAVDTISYLIKNGYPFRFVSNTTRRSRETIAGELRSMGFDIPVSHIFTPSMAAVSYIKAKGGATADILTTPDVSAEIVSEGIQQMKKEARFLVVGDAGDLFTYSVLNDALRLLLQGAELVALEKDRYWMGENGMMLSAGPFVTALEYASGKEAVVMGKPSREFFMLALASLNARPEQSVMIGDDVVTDVGGAVANGLFGILVRTGKFRQDSLDNALFPPSRVIDSIADLPDLLASGELCSG